MIELYEINVTLSKYQKEKICKAFHNREKILLRLKNDALSGSDTLLVPSKTLKSLKNPILDKSTFIEMDKNGTLFEKLTVDEWWENCCLLFNPTVVERLESQRKKEYKGMNIFLDYSLINDSIKYSVASNIEKLIEHDSNSHEFIDNELMIV